MVIYKMVNIDGDYYGYFNGDYYGCKSYGY